MRERISYKGVNLGAFSYEKLNTLYKTMNESNLDPQYIPSFLERLGFIKKGFIKRCDSELLVEALTKNHGYITLFAAGTDVHSKQILEPTDFSGILYVSRKTLDKMNKTDASIIKTLHEAK